MSIRPSERKAIRQGRLNVATCVTVNGRFVSDVCVPALNCACAAVETKVKNSVPRTNIFIVFPSSEFFVMANTTQSTRDRASLTTQTRLARMFWIMVPQAAISGWTAWRLRPTASHDLIFLRRVELGAIAAVIITNFAVLYFDFPSFAPFLPDVNIS